MSTKAKKSKKPRKKQAAPLPERPRPPVHFRSDAYLKPGTPAYEYDQSVLLDGVAKPDHQPATTAEFILLAVAQTQDYLATLVNELSVDDKAAAGRRLLWWAYRPDAAFARVSMVEALTDKLRAALKLIYPTMAIEVERRLGDLRQLAREYDGMKRWHENVGDWEDSPKLWDPDDLKKAAAELHETLGMISQAVHESNPAKRAPLAEGPRLVYEKLKSLDKHQAMTGPELLDWFSKEHDREMDVGTLRKHYLRPLKPWGLKNARKRGYYIEP